MLWFVALVVFLDLLAILLLALDEDHYLFIEDKIVPILIILFIPIFGAIIYISLLSNKDRSYRGRIDYSSSDFSSSSDGSDGGGGGD